MIFIIVAYAITSLLCFRVCYQKSGFKYGLIGLFFWPGAIIYGLFSGAMWKDLKAGYNEARKK